MHANAYMELYGYTSGKTLKTNKGIDFRTDLNCLLQIRDELQRSLYIYFF